MKAGLKHWIVVGLAWVAAGQVVSTAAESAQTCCAGIQWNDEAARRRNQVGLNYWLGYNVAVDFKRLGGFAPQTNPGPPTGGGIDRDYDNGYNRVDSSGSAGGNTWYWGYEDSAQVPGGGIINMNSSASYARAAENDVDEGATHGLEVFYRRELGELRVGYWGLEGAFAFTAFGVTDDSSERVSATVTTDTFQVGGVVVPMAPYQGTFNGPGPLISDSPTRVVGSSASATTITGRRELDMDLYSFRLGPYWDWPFSRRVGVTLAGGLALAVGDSDFQFRESVTVTGAGTVSRSGSDSQTDLLVGGFLAGQVYYTISEQWRAAAGIQFQHLGDFNQSSNGKEAVVDFDDALFVTIGVGYSF